MTAALSNTFRAFKSRNYSLFFFGQLISRIGMWMQRTAVIWVIYSITHSAFMLGLTTFAEQFPSFIFSPLGGIIADRYNRYKILMCTQIISAIQAVALTVLYITHHHQPWLILLLSVLLGIANAFDVPARQPMINDIVKDSADLPNAIAMNASLNNLARLIGPALAGFILAKYSAGICFGSNAFSFIAVIFSLMMMKLPEYIPPVKKRMGTDLKDGLQYVRSTPEIGNTLLLMGTVCFLVATYNTLIPIYAKEIFKGNAATYGYINAFIGAGALISTFFLASLKAGTDLKKVLTYNIIMLGLGLMLFSYTSFFPVALLLAVVCGFGTMMIIPICNTIIQMSSAAEMRGRVISFFAMAAFGTLPLGSLFIGWLSKWIGPQNCILAQGLIAIIIAAMYYLFLSKKTETATKQI